MVKLKRILFISFLAILSFTISSSSVSASYSDWDNYYQGNKYSDKYILEKEKEKMDNFLKIKDGLYTEDNYELLKDNYNFTYDSSKVSKWYTTMYGPLLDYASNNSSVAQQWSVNFSEDHFKNEKTAFIAYAHWASLADAKSASTIKKAPILLNDAENYLTSPVKRELDRMQTTNLVISGSDGLFGSTLGFGKRFNIVRIGGDDRYDTYSLMRMSGEKIFNPTRPNIENKTFINNVEDDIGKMRSGKIDNLVKSGNIEEAVKLLTSTTYGSQSNVTSGTPSVIARVDNSYFVGYYTKKKYSPRLGRYYYYGVYQYINKDYFLPNLRPEIEIKDSSGFINVDKIEKDKEYIAEVKVINDGKEDVNDTFDLGLYIDGNKKSTVDVQGGLGKGSSTFIKIPFKGSDIDKEDGKVEIRVKVDDSNKIEEIFEDDNWASIKIGLEDSKPEVTAQIIPQKAKCGQRVFFNINTTNYPDKLIIHLPFKDENNPSGKIIINITPAKYLNTRYEYFLPLDLNKQRYTVRVEAIRTKDYRTANDYPFVDIIGSILDKIKTRRK